MVSSAVNGARRRKVPGMVRRTLMESGFPAKRVTGSSRVWGTGAGKLCSIRMRSMPSWSTTMRRALATRSHWKDGSGPVSRKNCSPSMSVNSCNRISGRS